jgi:hypothetical protein
MRPRHVRGPHRSRHPLIKRISESAQRGGSARCCPLANVPEKSVHPRPDRASEKEGVQ